MISRRLYCVLSTKRVANRRSKKRLTRDKPAPKGDETFKLPSNLETYKKLSVDYPNVA